MSDDSTGESKAQIAALWQATFGEQPAIEADPQTMLRILVSCLEDVGPWKLGAPMRPPGGSSDALTRIRRS